MAGLITASQANAGVMVSFSSNVVADQNLFWNKVATPQTIQPLIARDSGEIYEFYTTSPQTTFAEGGSAGGVYGGTPSDDKKKRFRSLTFSANKTLLATNGQPVGSSFTFGAFSANIDAHKDGFLKVDVVGIGFSPFSTILSGLDKGMAKIV